MQKSLLLLAVLIGLSTSTVYGQHAGFVLFGEPNPDAKEVADQQKAVHPVTSPYFHEDSFVTTDLRIWYLYHDFPKTNGGGHANVYAAQVRVALTDQLQLVAYKDGYTDLDAGLGVDDGWNDIAAGIKWNFLQDWKGQLHAAVGAGYEFKTGDGMVFNNSSQYRLWASVNKGFDKLHLGATVNLHLTDDEHDVLGSSDTVSWHVHADYWLCEHFSPVVELNGYHTIGEGNRVVAFQGLDVDSLGGGKDESVVTVGVGGEIRPCDNAGFRFAYETPITDANDLFGYRWTFSLVLSF
ncbi:hypothetical protein HED60_21960 [Planctomycetales bacterium ZRK34]|nr:hypothetical protein HED60_21960 [Planctomycetales bacterium ZRK34]